jgi:hypothetical protein
MGTPIAASEPSVGRTGRLLVAYSNSSTHVATTREYLESFARYSQFEVRYVHVTNGAIFDFDINQFDVILQSYCARLPFDGLVSADFIEKFKSFNGIKMIAVQDEYDYTNKLKLAMQQLGYHVVFTAVPQSMLEKVYPEEEFPDTEFISVLTGYVSDQLMERGRTASSLGDRPIHLGYRGRALPARYGRLGFEKFEIGRRMRSICIERRVPHDIEWEDGERIYGDAWYDFIASCRAVLGTESGSNVFDFDGEVAAQYQEMTAARGGPVTYSEFRMHTDPIEARYDMAQISPRIFEAAALHTPMILFTGRYSGLIEPDTHYIELKKDFSNIDAVLAQLDDLEGLSRMAQRAYDRLVGSAEFSYRRFAGAVDETIRRKAKELGIVLRVPRYERDVAQPVFDPTEIASFREQPTASPRHSAIFWCKQLARENVALKKEIVRLNEVYPAEIKRLNEVYPAEIERLKKEIVRLNEVYPLRYRVGLVLSIVPAPIRRLVPVPIRRLSRRWMA